MKKIFILAFAVVMTLSAITFSGCGKNEEQETESKAAVSESTEDEAATAATEMSSGSTEPSSAASSTEATTASTQSKNAATSNKKQANTNTSRSSNGSQGTNRMTSSSGNTAVTNVSLSKGNMTVNVGSSASFEVYINPESATDRQYNVTTSNGNATVTCSGSTVTVYGQNKGNCTMTVSSTNGKSAVCNVTVASSSGGSGSRSGGNSNGGSNRNSGGNGGAVNDNTPLTHKQICTDKVMGRVCEAVNNYFKEKGMTYDSSKNINNSGWFLSGSNYYKSDNVYSINRIIKEETEGFYNELYGYYMSNPQDDISKMYSGRFRCYYVRESNGEYSIYFCH